MGLQNKMKRINDQAIKPLMQALLPGFEARFQPILSDQEYILSSILHPKFKLSFLPANSRPNQKQLLLDYIVKENAEVSNNANNALRQSVPRLLQVHPLWLNQRMTTCTASWMLTTPNYLFRKLLVIFCQCLTCTG